MAATVPIPQPPTLPFIGNLTLIDAQHPLESIARIADQYGTLRETTPKLDS